MNKSLITGNLTRDPELKTTPQGTSVATFTIAAQRRFKNQSGGYDADFINCVAWRTTAEFIAKHFAKGSRIGVVGTIQTRSYDDKNGNKRYITEVVVEEAEFGGKIEKRQEEQKGFTAADEAEMEEITAIDDADLPF